MNIRTKLKDKIYYFEYFLSEVTNNYNIEDVSYLKAQKLILFLINSLIVNNKYKLLDIFDNFHVLSYGLIEADLHKAIKSSEDLKYFKLDRFGTENIKPFEKIIENEITELIKEGLSLLHNYDLLNKSTSYLVDLDMCHESWCKNYRELLNGNKDSKQVSKDDLISERKYFSLGYL